MRLRLSLIVGSVGMLACFTGDGRAQSDNLLDELSGSSSQNLLVGPRQGQRNTDDTRNLSAPPSTGAGTGEAARGREISPAERQELLQNRTRESAPEWGSRDRN